MDFSIYLYVASDTMSRITFYHFGLMNHKLWYLIKKKKIGFTPCKAEQPLRGMELQEKEV